MNIENHIKTTRPLSEHQKAIINMIFTTSYLTDELGIVLKSFDISLQQFNVLRILKGQKGKPANLSTIQERMVHKMSNTTRLVDKLVSKNLVDRAICPTNRRKVEITITKKGLEFLDEVSPVFAKTEEQLTKNLTQKELLQLNILLDKLRN